MLNFLYHWRISWILFSHTCHKAMRWRWKKKCNIMTSKIVISPSTKGFFFSKQKLISCKFHPPWGSRFSNRKKNEKHWWWKKKKEKGEIMAFGKNVCFKKIAYACRALDFISLKSFIWKSLILWFLLLLLLLATYVDSNQIIPFSSMVWY